MYKVPIIYLPSRGAHWTIRWIRFEFSCSRPGTRLRYLKLKRSLLNIIFHNAILIIIIRESVSRRVIWYRGVISFYSGIKKTPPSIFPCFSFFPNWIQWKFHELSVSALCKLKHNFDHFPSSSATNAKITRLANWFASLVCNADV